MSKPINEMKEKQFPVWRHNEVNSVFITNKLFVINPATTRSAEMKPGHF